MVAAGAAGIVFGARVQNVVGDALGSGLGGLLPGGDRFRIYTITNTFPVIKPSKYRLKVTGLVDRPLNLTLADLQSMPKTSLVKDFQCVTGWRVPQVHWEGVRLADVLAMARPKAGARYAIFSCFDRDEQGTHYYESLDLTQAAHPQTLLALDLNDTPLDNDHGAPVRLRIPTQLGYKSAKWVSRIELASTFANAGGGKGGYWEDQGYEWYAGI